MTRTRRGVGSSVARRGNVTAGEGRGERARNGSGAGSRGVRLPALKTCYPASPTASYPNAARLPQRLYKYLELQYAELLVAGVAHFSSLSWFQNFEDEGDEERGDEFEGRLKYFPVNGVTITKEHAPPFRIPDGSFQSAVRERDHVFVLSTSRELSEELREKFRRPKADNLACVEIFDPNTFVARLAASLQKRSPVQQRTFFHNAVTYYPAAEVDPNPTWALPHLLVMHKRECFDYQKEYRFTFSTKKHALKTYAIETVIEQEGSRRPRVQLDPKAHCKNITLGSMADVCRLVPFPD